MLMYLRMIELPLELPLQVGILIESWHSEFMGSVCGFFDAMTTIIMVSIKEFILKK